ncbi:hypothetical protein GGI08_003213 [Coemansia sp. S2]|nr:hypothetical protein GGI08_003213 [Coemansia sp. S2]
MSQVTVDESFKLVSHLKTELQKFDRYKDGNFDIRFIETTKSTWLSWYYTAKRDAGRVRGGNDSTNPTSDDDPLQYKESLVYFVNMHAKAKPENLTGQTDSASAASDLELAKAGFVVV